MASGEPSKQEHRSWLSPVRILSGVTSTASTIYQAAGFVQEDKDNMAAKEVGMNVDSDGSLVL